MRQYDRGTAQPHLLGLRPQVFAFAQLMELKLQQNDGKKEHWIKNGLSATYAHFQCEVAELHSELYGFPVTPALVALEAADVACLAMMVADCVRGLQYEEKASDKGERESAEGESSGGAGGGA